MSHTTYNEPHPPTVSAAEERRAVMFVALTVLFGAVSLVCAFVPAWHIPGTWTGAAGMGMGAIAQFYSTSTPQRWCNIIGWGMAFLGLLMGVTYGGFV